jgi:hypothetical protein
MKKPGSLKAGWDLADFDYMDDLPPKERAWLMKFKNEYYRNRLTPTKNIHKSKKQKKALYQADNERRRDIWNCHDRVLGDTETMEDLDDEKEKS